MKSAVYYPHTQLKNISLLKTSLMLWDKVEFIVPFEGFGFNYGNPLVERAVEIIGRERCPTNSEKSEAHALIEDFATGNLPDSFFYNESMRHAYYQHGMWPQKLLPETWRMLQDLRLVGDYLPNADYPLQDAVGLCLMSILADCCAGKSKARITDRAAAYASLTSTLVDKNCHDSGNSEIIIPITLKLIDTSDMPLERLISYRERERCENGNTLRDLRTNYANRVQAHLNDLRQVELVSDLTELNENFEEDMRRDLSALRQEISGSKQEAALSKEFLITTVAAIGSLWSAMHGLPIEIPGVVGVGGVAVTAGGLAATGKKYNAARLATLRKHPMAYLYELT